MLPKIRLTTVTIAAILTITMLSRADRYVAQLGQTPGGGYTNWSCAASSIQAAVDAATDGETIWISNGVYTASGVSQVVNIYRRSLKLRGLSGNPEDVIIDGQGAQGVKSTGINLNLSSSVNDVLLEGLTVSNAHTSNNGAGIYLYHTGAADGSLEIRNCIITDNYSTNHGAGLYMIGTSSSDFQTSIIGTTIRDNMAYGSGGGLMISVGGKFLMQDCVIERNGCRGDTSGGMRLSNIYSTIRNTDFLYNTNYVAWAGAMEFNRGALIENCVVIGNRGAYSGGLFHRNGGTPPAVVRNCLIAHNTSTGNPQNGGFYFWSSGPTRTVTNVLENCTFVGSVRNYLSESGGGYSRLVAINTIFANSVATQGNVEFFATNSLFDSARYAAVPAVVQGTGNMCDDPKFLDTGADDYHLQSGSPALNSGYIMPWMAGAEDLEGNPRIDRATGTVDMGCYEYMYTGALLLLR